MWQIYRENWEHFNKEYGENIARKKGKFRKQKRRNIGLTFRSITKLIEQKSVKFGKEGLLFLCKSKKGEKTEKSI